MCASAELMTETLFALEEPWRSRFLTLVAGQATAWTWAGGPPTRGEVVTWLTDTGLRRYVRLMLNAWLGDWAHSAEFSC
jgi:hypothetical protein